jgi:hypothetical protein
MFNLMNFNQITAVAVIVLNDSGLVTAARENYPITTPISHVVEDIMSDDVAGATRRIRIKELGLL